MNRSIAAIAMLSIAVPLMWGCKGSPGPRAAFEGWLKAIEKCESARIKAGLTSESIDAIEKMSQQLKAFLPPEKAENFDFFGEQMCKGFKPGTVSVKSEEVTGETAVVLITAEGKDQKIPMKKQGGLWKIDFQALIGGAAGPHAAPPPAKVKPPVPAQPAPVETEKPVEPAEQPATPPAEKPADMPAKTE